jgi:hypothetical protein
MQQEGHDTPVTPPTGLRGHMLLRNSSLLFNQNHVYASCLCPTLSAISRDKASSWAFCFQTTCVLRFAYNAGFWLCCKKEPFSSVGIESSSFAYSLYSFLVLSFQVFHRITLRHRHEVYIRIDCCPRPTPPLERARRDLRNH